MAESEMKVRRFPGNPVIRPNMLYSVGGENGIGIAELRE